MNRRQFLGGSLAATTLFAGNAWATASAATVLAGAKYSDGRYGIEALTPDRQSTTLLTSQHRLHGFAVSPDRRWLVAPARRPGNLLILFDMQEKRQLSVSAPDNRHYYGHGIFDRAGDYFFTTENDYQNERGMLAVYNVHNGFTRIAETQSDGIGPHELCLAPDGQSLVIANGGILTHPDTGRQILNPGTLESNLTRIGLPDLAITDQIRLPAHLASLSLRHMAMTPENAVIVGAQDQNPGKDSRPLVWHWHKDRIQALATPADGWRAMKNYIGSVVTSGDGHHVAASSPRGGRVMCWNIDDGMEMPGWSAPDICGLAPSGNGTDFMATTGTGKVMTLQRRGQSRSTVHDLRYDNHCLAL